MVADTFETVVQGPTGLVNGWSLQMTFTEGEMQTLLDAYDPTSGTSPDAATCRPIVRQMLDAVLAVRGS